MSYRVIQDEETGEDRVLLTVPRLSVEDMRDRVIRILSGELYPSDQVRDPSILEMVFMPLALGALRPDDEAILKYLGSTSPPETIEGDPEKPEHPGYPDPEAEEPVYPELIRPNPKLKSDVEWGDAEPEEWGAHLAKVEAQNQALLRAWEQEVEKHDVLRKAYQTVCGLVDAAHEKTLEDWREELASFQDRVVERERLRKEWTDKYDRVFKLWGSDLGVMVGDMRKAAPRSINGHPIFFGFEVIHRDDWDRIYNALVRETERSKTIEV